MNYEENTMLIAEFMEEPLLAAWLKQQKESSFPYHLLQYHKKWSILKPVVERVYDVAMATNNYWALPVRALLSHSIADKIDDVYADLINAINFLHNPKSNE